MALMAKKDSKIFKIFMKSLKVSNSYFNRFLNISCFYTIGAVETDSSISDAEGHIRKAFQATKKKHFKSVNR